MELETESVSIRKTTTTTTSLTASTVSDSTAITTEAMVNDAKASMTTGESAEENKSLNGLGEEASTSIADTADERDAENSTRTDAEESLEATSNDAGVAPAPGASALYANSEDKKDTDGVSEKEKEKATEPAAADDPVAADKDSSGVNVGADTDAEVAEKAETPASDVESRLELPSLTTTNDVKSNDALITASSTSTTTTTLDNEAETAADTEKESMLEPQRSFLEEELSVPDENGFFDTDDEDIAMEMEAEREKGKQKEREGSAAAAAADTIKADTDATTDSPQPMEEEVDELMEAKLEEELDKAQDSDTEAAAAAAADQNDEYMAEDIKAEFVDEDDQQEDEVVEEMSKDDEPSEETLAGQASDESSADEDENVSIITPIRTSSENTPDVFKDEDFTMEDAPLTDTDKDDEPVQSNKKTSKSRGRGSNKKSPKKNSKKGKARTLPEPEEKEEEEPEQEIAQEEYEVEAIVNHKIYKGKVVKYEIKWKGYPSEDNTLESATTIHDDVPALCIAYWASQPESVSRPSNIPKPIKSKKAEQKGKQKEIVQQDINVNSADINEHDRHNSPAAIKEEGSSAQSKKPALRKQQPRSKTAAGQKRTHGDMSGNDAALDDEHTRKHKKAMEHIPPYMAELNYHFPKDWPNEKTNWNLDVKKICVQQSPLEKKKLFCFVEWNNGQRTIHQMKEVHQKIPGKLIQYYEERLQFV